MSKYFVAYFSASGETARLAKTVAGAVGGDLYEIAPEQRYSTADLNWQDQKSRSTLEMKDEASRPAIAGKAEGIQEAEYVLVGFPIWWYQAPRVIQTFLESYDFSGKTVIPFCTSGGSGLGKTVEILKKSCSDSTKWKEGKRFSSRAGEGEIRSWIDSLGLSD